MKKLFLLMTTVLLMTVCAIAQTKVVSGTVVFAGDNEPLPGATVMPVGGGHGTSTDLDGKFTLTVPASVTKLKVSYVGMIEQLVNAGQDLTIKLNNSENNLDEVMVVAYGTAKKSAYTGSASVVKADQIEARQVTDAVSALAGTVAGAQVLTTNGQPGSSPKVLIRGVGSLNASTSPLYVVDGMPFDGDIASLNTNDIESMTVLKDAAAAALYGARGANGVILITTKRGKVGDAKVTFDAKWGSNSREIKAYDVIKDPATYTEMTYAALRNGYLYHQNGATALGAHQYASSMMPSAFGAGYQIWTVPAGQEIVGMNGKLNPAATLGYNNGRNYIIPDNWADETFEHGFRQEYNATISGGTDRFQFYGSFGFLSDDGIVRGSFYDRLSSRVGVDYQAKKWLTVGSSIAYNHVKMGYPSGQDGDGGTANNAFQFCNTVAPVYPMYVRNADGTLMIDSRTGNPVYDYGDGKYALGTNRRYMGGGNAASSFIYNKSDVLMDILSAKWYAKLTPIENLDITGTVGYFLDNTRNHDIMSPYYGAVVGYGGMAQQSFARTRALNLQALANYRKTFADVHHADFLLGYESYDLNGESLYAYGYNLYDPNSWSVSNTLNNANRGSGGGNPTNYTTRGIFGRINYDYDSRYFASVSYRRDASSRFAPDKRWGNFYSLSVAWDAAKESFMHSTATWLDLLKVKASFGQQGNDNIGTYYAYQDKFLITGENTWSDGSLYNNYGKGNPDLTWETSNALNAGIEFSFWQGKLAGNVDYFQRQTSDMLYWRPVAPSLGYSYFPMNVGSLRNYGIEIELNYRPVSTRDITWDINFNGTWIQNKIIKLNPEAKGRILRGLTVWEEGKSQYNYYLVKYAGVNPENGEPLYWDADPILDEQGNPVYDKHGVAKHGPFYKSNNYDHAYANARQETGNVLPTFYGGFGTNIKFYGFDFGIAFSYQLGGKIYDHQYGKLMHQGDISSLGTNFHTDMLNAWTPENTNTNIPKLDSRAHYNLGNGNTDFNLVSSDYLSLNNITFGYSLPGKLIAGLGIESVRIYAAAENIALWSKRKGLDPRMSLASTSDYQAYSPIRTVSGGLKVVF